MMAEPEDEDEPEEEWEVTPHKFGAHIIDEIAVHTAPKQVYKEAKPFIDNLIRSSNPFERRSACGGLTVLSRGCGALMASDLESWLLPIV